MNLVFIDLVVIAGGITLIVFLLWFFFGPKAGKAAVLQAGVQEATVRVEGAYQPNGITLQVSVPTRLKFDRREATDCSNRVVIPGFDISRALPALQTTAIDFTPREPGEYPFAFAMNMYRGALVVQPDGREPDPAVAQPAQVRPEVAPRPSAEERPAKVEPEHAAGTSEYNGEVISFCSPGCKQRFDREPERYVGSEAR